MPEYDAPLPADTAAGRNEIELRRRTRDVAHHVRRLEADRRALEELVESVAAEENALRRQVAQAADRRAALEDDVARERRRLARTDDEMEAIRREILQLERRCRDQGDRRATLVRATEEVQGQVARLERAFAATRLELGTVKESLSRIDGRLHRLED